MSFFWGVFAGLVLVAVVRWLHGRLAHARDALSDDQIRAIEEAGALEIDDPLDLDHIRDEETRFWEESWDEPDEF